ncbi:MAG: hypothetical protein ACWGPN_08965 [Gammaproteobacteria bacterium]
MRTCLSRGLLAAVLMSLLAGLAGCGGEVDLTCDEPRRYQEAVQSERLRAPDGLDTPQPYLEMPVPEANPRPERPKGSPCLDLPPRIQASE